MPSRRRSQLPMIGVAACLLGLAGTGVLALLVPAAQRRDYDALQVFADLDRPHTDSLITNLAHLADPMTYALLGLLLVVIASMRGGMRLAGAIVVLLTASALTTQILKHVLAKSPSATLIEATKISAGSWPSGHSTAAMALALAAVLVAAPRWRPVIGLGAAAFALAVGFSTVALEWHFPSDVLGGFLVSGFWASAALIWLRAEREVEARDVKRAAFAASGAAAFATATVIATIQPAFAVAALAIAAVAIALVAAMSSIAAPRPRAR